VTQYVPNKRQQEAVGEQPPFSFSISTPSLFNSGGATPLTFSQMNLTRKRIIRFLLGVLLPLPLFVGSF
jgi:hypothetical protein